ncbi:MAG TPA: carbohydrate ABC transporter permease, partial [Candidimonas sp.]|nr:carbohydrate ABC transporter permease [Candidimonas sp.]
MFATKTRWAHLGARVGHFGIIAAFVAFTAFPFYWMLITTFKTTLDLVDTANNPFLFNSPPTLDNLRVLFFDTQYGR